MSLHPQPSTPFPPQTRQVAQAAFPRGNCYLQLRDTLGTLYDDALLADLFPPRGQAAQAPWQLAVVTLLQFAEHLSDRQAADAVRSRIDWKYLLGLELTDPGIKANYLLPRSSSALRMTWKLVLVANAPRRGWAIRFI